MLFVHAYIYIYIYIYIYCIIILVVHVYVRVILIYPNLVAKCFIIYIRGVKADSFRLAVKSLFLRK